MLLSRLAIAVAFAGCGDAVTLTIASDRPVPSAIDAICVGIGDRDASGGMFGRRYALEGAIAQLPQTLLVEAGGADAAIAWVRGDRGGVPAAWASAAIDFGDDVTVGLATCVRGPGAAPVTRSSVTGPQDARLVATQGQGGTLVVAFGDTTAVALDANGATLEVRPLAISGGAVAIAIDIDADCDDDLAVAGGGEIAIWRRDAMTFVAAGSIATSAAALAAADIDGDGAMDLVAGSGGSVTPYLNDGGGSFSAGATLPGNGVTAVSALATGDLDGDGLADVVAGQASGPVRAWFGAGGGTFVAAPAATPGASLDVVGMTLVDADNDYAPDLALALRDAPMRLWIDRGGALEDQSFVRLPDPAPIAGSIAIGGWDDGCEPDAVIVRAGGGAYLRGLPTGALEARTDAPPGGASVVLADIDDDGDLDALVAGPEGITWLAR